MITNSIGERELLACSNAVQMLSTRLNSNLSKDPPQAIKDLLIEIERESQTIDKLMDHPEQ